MIATGTALLLHRDSMPPGMLPVIELPAWVRPAAGRYWHMPRSAFRKPHGRWISVHFWCGQIRRVANRRGTWSAEPAEEYRCGTCVGRRAGFDQVDGLIFRPRDPWALPPRCPGRDWDDPKTRQCMACGRVTNWSHSTPAGSGLGIAQHRPEPELATRWAPCRWHGWRSMGFRDERLVCFAFQCTTVVERRSA